MAAHLWPMTGKWRQKARGSEAKQAREAAYLKHCCANLYYVKLGDWRTSPPFRLYTVLAIPVT